MIRKYECIKNFPNTTIIVGDIIEIEKLNDGMYVIDGAIGTDSNVVYEFFKIKRLEGWKYSPYSFSKMDSWKQCPKRFEYTYIIKPEQEEVPSPVLEKGILTHAVLEYSTIDKLEDFELDEELKALSKRDAEDIINSALIFTDTSKDYKWIKSLTGIKVTEQEIFLGNKMQPVENLEDALIRGFIDLIIFDEKNKICYIFDWKTGGKSKEALQKWPKPKDQLELYAIWAQQVFDVETIIGAFVYVEHDYMAKYEFNKTQIPTLIKKFNNQINNIENDEKFEKSLSQLCAWCDCKEPCLGIDPNKDPRSITKEEIFSIVKGTNKTNQKNTAFFNKLKAKSKN